MKNEKGYGRDSIIFFDGTSKECRRCFQIKPLSEFHKDSSNRYGTAYWCKICAGESGKKHHVRRMKEDASYREAMKTRYKKRVFGLTQEQYVARLKAQGQKCSICHRALPLEGHLTHLDHDHSSGKIREFLCTNCNRGLGHFQDDPELLLIAAAYLQRHSVNDENAKEDT